MDFSTLTERALGAIKKTFGTSVTYTPQSGDPVPIDGVFNKRFYEYVGGSDAPLVTEQPNLLVQLSDLDSDPAEGDQVTVNGTTYEVTESQKDGEGAALLFLNEV